VNRLLQRELSGDDQEEAEVGEDEPSQASALNLYRRMDLELKFQGVDVGGIFNRLVDTVAMRRALQITVAEEGDKAIVSGGLHPDGKGYVYAT
jgi:hypothetical protein